MLNTHFWHQHLNHGSYMPVCTLNGHKQWRMTWWEMIWICRTLERFGKNLKTSLTHQFSSSAGGKFIRIRQLGCIKCRWSYHRNADLHLPNLGEHQICLAIWWPWRRGKRKSGRPYDIRFLVGFNRIMSCGWVWNVVITNGIQKFYCHPKPYSDPKQLQIIIFNYFFIICSLIIICKHTAR